MKRVHLKRFTVPVTVLMYLTLNSATMLLGFDQDSEKEVSVMLLNTRSVGGSGPDKREKYSKYIYFRVLKHIYSHINIPYYPSNELVHSLLKGFNVKHHHSPIHSTHHSF